MLACQVVLCRLLYHTLLASTSQTCHTPDFEATVYPTPFSADARRMFIVLFSTSHSILYLSVMISHAIFMRVCLRYDESCENRHQVEDKRSMVPVGRGSRLACSEGRIRTRQWLFRELPGGGVRNGKEGVACLTSRR